MKQYSKIVLASFALILLSSEAALAAPPPPGGGTPPCWPPPCIPVDNGVIFLLIAGLALAALKFYSSFKSEKA